MEQLRNKFKNDLDDKVVENEPLNSSNVEKKKKQQSLKRRNRSKDSKGSLDAKDQRS